MGLPESMNLIKFCKNVESRHVITLDHGRGTSARVGDLQKGKVFPVRQQVQSYKGTGVCSPAVRVDTCLGICHSRSY